MSPCLTLSIIRYRSRVKWSNPGKGVAPSPTPWCSSYRKGSLRVTLDYGRQLYFYFNIDNLVWSFSLSISQYFSLSPSLSLSLYIYIYAYIYIYIYIYMWVCVREFVSDVCTLTVISVFSIFALCLNCCNKESVVWIIWSIISIFVVYIKIFLVLHILSTFFSISCICHFFFLLFSLSIYLIILSAFSLGQLQVSGLLYGLFGIEIKKICPIRLALDE